MGQSEIRQKLEQEVTAIKEKMKKRGELLRERTKAYQVTGGDLTFLNVLLDSDNISEFIDRAGTVAMIIQADHNLLKKQEDEKSTDSIKNSGKQIPAGSLQPGDLVFFDTFKQDGHVGIYIGNGQFTGSQCNTGVAVADMSIGYWKEKFNGRVIRF